MSDMNHNSGMTRNAINTERNAAISLAPSIAVIIFSLTKSRRAVTLLMLSRVTLALSSSLLGRNGLRYCEAMVPEVGVDKALMLRLSVDKTPQASQAHA